LAGLQPHSLMAAHFQALISNPERSTVTRRDHPRSRRRRHRAIHFRQAFGWVVRPAVDTATISCLCGRRRARSCRYGQNAGSGERGKNDGYVRKHNCISQGSAGSHSRENHTFQVRPNRPPSGNRARPRQRQRTSRRPRGQRRDWSSHLCSVASYQLLHLAPVNPATSRLVRLLAIRACGRPTAPQDAQAAESGDTMNHPHRLVMDTVAARHRESYAP